GIADLAFFATATLEDAQHIARFSDLPSTQRIKCRQHSFVFGFLWGWWRPGEQALRLAVFGIALAKTRVLQRIGSVVIKRRTPQHGAVRHHAGADVTYLLYVTAGASTGVSDDAQIARIYELNEFPALVEPIGVCPYPVGSLVFVLFVAGLDVG